MTFTEQTTLLTSASDGLVHPIDKISKSFDNEFVKHVAVYPTCCAPIMQADLHFETWAHFLLSVVFLKIPLAL